MAGGNEDTVDMIGGGGDKFISHYKKMQEPMDLDEMICRSICTIDNIDSRKKMANSIILIGGGSKIKKFTDSLEEAVMDRFTSGFDKEIERVNVELYNV
jgi:actin-related protein